MKDTSQPKLRPSDVNSVEDIVQNFDPGSIEQDQAIHTLFLKLRPTGVKKTTLEKQVRQLREKMRPAGKSKDERWEFAKMLAEGGQFIHGIDDQTWRYNGRYWHTVTNAVVQQYVQHQIDFRGSHLDDESRAAAGQVIAHNLKVCAARAEDAFEFHKGIKPVVNFTNQEMWIERFQDWLSIDGRPHRPESYLVNGVDYEWRESADPENPCPLWQKTLREVVGWRPWMKGRHIEQDYIEQAQNLEEQIAYIVMPIRDHVCIFFWIGEGENGKSMLLNILNAVGGSGIANINLDGLDPRFGPWGLMDKIALVDDDFNAEKPLPISDLKKYSGEKMFMVEPKGGKPFTAQLQLAILLLGNHFPFTKDTSHGWHRRAKPIYFPMRFVSRLPEDYREPDQQYLAATAYLPKEQQIAGDAAFAPGMKNIGYALRDPDRQAQLMACRHDIFNSLWTARVRLHNRRRFNDTAHSSLAASYMTMRSNPIMVFLEDCYEPDEKSVIYVRDFKQHYAQWALINNFPSFNQHTFKNRALEAGLGVNGDYRKYGGYYVIRGYRLKPVVMGT